MDDVPTILDVAALDVPQLERIRDAVNRRLLELRETRNLQLSELLSLLEATKRVLEEQGKEWHSLERWQWMDGGIRFWLNPIDQDRYASGWYTIDDLIRWSHNRGPVIVDQELEDELAGDVSLFDLPAGDMAIRRISERAN